MSLRRLILAVCFAPSLATMSLSVVTAQDFSVYAVVTNGDAPEGASNAVLASSFTMFHAGKSYDYMKGVDEVVICDPHKREFTILYGGRRGTKVAFDELTQYLNVGRNETEQYAREIELQTGRQELADAIRFPVLPSFETSLDDDRLTMEAPFWTYNVTLAEPEADTFAARYADYADAAARLNFVLHPQSFYPAVRESLNEQLRRHRQVPTRVALEAKIGEPVRLEANYTFSWQLNDYARRQIRHFDKLMTSDAVQWVSFREYQQRLVAER